MEVEAPQTQAYDSQGNLILVPKVAQEEKTEVVLTPVVASPAVSSPATLSPSRSRKATESPTIPAEFADKDPLALKLESALKRSIADRTGDLKLKQEAALQQSLADKMGARAVMSKEQLERTKKEAEQLRIEAAAKQSIADRTGDAALKKEAAAQQHLADKLIASANKSLAALAAGEDKPTPPAVVVPTPVPTVVEPEIEPSLIVQVLQDALKALLESAAQKQSQADRTGDLKLKQEAALAQSKVDKMRAQLQNELKGLRQQATSPQAPRLVQQATPPTTSPVQRSPHIPRPPPADSSFTTSGVEKYKPPGQRALQQQQAMRQRSPQLAQMTAGSDSYKKESKDKKDKNHSDKPADRANNAKSWRRRESYTPAPPSPPSVPSNENKQPNQTVPAVKPELKPLPLKITRQKADATTNCSEEEFEQQA